ncbi:MAG: magnesium chelatase ATPase subunit [Chlorobi bacterium]|nr:magnesium chelatase ATPase subunit [Chlorobiota bacterium]
MADSSPTYLPFSAFLGFSAARRALLCTLVDPTLRGVLLSGPIGTGKSALLRSFGAFVRAHADPGSPFVQVPLGVGDERLIGGLDFDVAISTGRRRLRRGLIAEADGGFLFVDDIPLLDELSTAVIAGALENEFLLCEREGFSERERSRFVLLATAAPSERELPAWAVDKVGFLVAEEQRISPDAVRLLISRIGDYDRDPAALYDRWRQREESLARQVTSARLLHPFIALTAANLVAIATESLRLNVAGNRADIFAAKAARAHAALRGSRNVDDVDIKFAIATVLLPRSENVPDESRGSDERSGSPETPSQEPQASETPSPETTSPETQSEGTGSEERSEPGEGESGGGERVYEPLDFTRELPRLGEFFSSTRRNVVSGSRGNSEQWRRGRHIRSIQRDPQGKRIAIGATLRAAAPHQKERRGDQGGLIIRSEDIRIKRFSERAGTLFIFCVDASGSMAANRMREAKGAVTQLLQEAYIHRDTVALIAFRGAESEVLLPPTNSVERAKRSLDILPTGGGTPLASALVKAFSLAQAARRRGVEQTLIVLMTDGRANVPLTESAAGMIMEIRRRHVRGELEHLALAYRRAAIDVLVVDTRQTFGATSDAVKLAEMLDAGYYYLPQIDARGLANAVKSGVRGGNRPGLSKG